MNQAKTADNGKAAEQSVRWYAEEYANLGFAVLPVYSIADGKCTCRKSAACANTGKHPRTHNGCLDGTTDPKKIKTWRWETANIGIATGAVSDLLVLDIDPRNGGNESFEQLLRCHGSLPSAPEVLTGGGGRHLYFRMPTIATKPKMAAGIELKGTGGFVVAPPSIHKSGERYKWITSPRKNPVPDLPDRWATAVYVTGGMNAPLVTQTAQTTQDITGQTQDTNSGSSQAKTPLSAGEYVKQCMEKSLPDAPGKRHYGLFHFARLLRGHPEIGALPVEKFRSAVMTWHKSLVEKLGIGNVQATPEESWWDFAEGWEHVKYPGGHGLMSAIADRARQNAPPLIALQYPSDEIRFLVSLCRELQREHGDGPFFLATATAAEMLSIDRMRAWRCLNGLVRDDVLELVERGDVKGRRASKYRYKGD